MANMHIHKSVSKFAKFSLIIFSILFVTSCGQSSSEKEGSILISEATAQKQVDSIKQIEPIPSLLDSLALVYPNGTPNTLQNEQTATLLKQNPAVLTQLAQEPKLSQSASIRMAQLGVVAQAVNTDVVKVLRIQNTTLPGSYFFTIYESEKATALASNPSWRYEGPGFYASSQSATNLSPVWRFRNKINGSYVFSIYESERLSIVTNYASTFEYEGVSWYASQTQLPGYTPLYRFRNVTNGTYLFSAYESEKISIQTNYPTIFAYEGVAYYVRISDVYSGRFVDAPVTGLSYQTATRSGVTDPGGYFQYDTPGESITFGAGAISIGSAKANAQVDVYSLLGDVDDRYGNKQVRVAQLLQSLDQNRGTGQVIKLPTTLVTTLTNPSALNFVGTQSSYDTSLQALLTSMQIGSQFVPSITAKAKADAFIQQTLTECPLPNPPLPSGENNGIYNVVTGNLTCIDRAKINFYNAIVRNMIRSTIDLQADQVGVISETFSPEAAAAANDSNPVLAALETIDAAADAVDSVNKKNQVDVVANVAKAVMGGAQTIVKYVVNFTTTDGTAVKEGTTAVKYIELASKIADLIGSAVPCITYVTHNSGKSADAAACVKAISESLTVAQKGQALADLTFTINSAADQALIQAQLTLLASTIATADATLKLASTDAATPNKLKRAAFGAAAAALKAARSGISLAYINKSGTVPTTGWEAVALGTLDYVATPLLNLGTACYGITKASLTAFTKCLTAQASEFGKAATTGAFAYMGSAETILHVGKLNDAVVAQAVLEELLWTGAANYNTLFTKYGIVYDGSTERTRKQSYENLVSKIALIKYTLNGVSGLTSWASIVKAAVWNGQNSFYLEDALSLIQAYLSLIEQGTEPDFWSPSVKLTATSTAAGTAKVTAVVDPSISGFVNGNLVCHSSTSSNYPIATAWSTAVSGASTFTISFNYASGGTKGIYCALYKAGNGVFVGSNAVAIAVVAPVLTNPLTDTGITASQCYQAGSDVLVSCTSPAAIALSDKQDGMLGRDVTAPNASDGKLGFSYSTVGSYPVTDCVKDNVTGLIWEGKPTTGTRANILISNNNGINTSNYVNDVNNAGLCGYSDWRTPTLKELQSIVDNGVTSSVGPTVDSIWFPNTATDRAYWTYPTSIVVHFKYGYSATNSAISAFYIRLVR